MPIAVLPLNHPDRIAAEAEWLAHVRAGRIGSPPVQTSAQRIRHARNELAVLGALK